MAYNMSYMDNSTNLLDIFVGINTQLSGGLASVILLIIAIVSFVLMKSYDTEVALLVSSFLTSVVSVIFFITGLIGIEILSIPLVVLLITIFMNVINK